MKRLAFNHRGILIAALLLGLVIPWSSMPEAQSVSALPVRQIVLVRDLKRTHGWPLVLRIKSARSPLGAITVENADNGKPGAGAVWVFNGPGAYLPGRALATNYEKMVPRTGYEFSQPRILRFRISDTGALTGIPRSQSLLEAPIEILTGK